ncbi:MAG: glycosyltransferase, partial [bacterium]|nr:glycosyltransferase [bacterium]
MQVAISVPGRFHLFNLAGELLKKNYLSQLITSYPKFEVTKYGIPKDKINSILVKEVLLRGYQRLPSFIQNLYNPQYFIHEIFDKLAERSLKKADIVVGGSSVFLHTLRKAKKMGAITVTEHGSSHIVHQNEILKSEYEEFGVKIKPFLLPHPRIIEKELQEYAESDYIVIPSLFAKKTFLQKGIPENKIIQVPYGVDLSRFHQLQKKDNVFRVVFAGGMTLRKGVHYLLRAFSELKLPNAELVLAGGLNDEIKPFFKKYNVV